MAVTDILKIEIWQLRTIGSQKSIPSVPIALGTYYGGYMGCLVASTGTNIALNKIGRLMDYFLLSFSLEFMAIAAWLDRAKWHIHTR